ncbi:hypothetical protein DUNSADRAFT_3252 [Dunaliella salina]|uniref:USP domain-containing protein n=1 Tax=Dunaliella salina TaxID=3046 RepID=A0ABQ7GUK3_DUNSA|nr:hypothetical protein DUNSADRAFT_3252 [Dunaliella salina]|eukprot:KAF5838205.1 hypothetical protein DUNSADRAFT_3252 [Dunaliella salina]
MHKESRDAVLANHACAAAAALDAVAAGSAPVAALPHNQSGEASAPSSEGSFNLPMPKRYKCSKMRRPVLESPPSTRDHPGVPPPTSSDDEFNMMPSAQRAQHLREEVEDSGAAAAFAAADAARVAAGAASAAVDAANIAAAIAAATTVPGPEGHQPIAPPGIVNGGLSCWLGSLLQAYAASSPLMDLVHDGHNLHGPVCMVPTQCRHTPCVLELLRQFLSDVMMGSPQGVVDASRLLDFFEQQCGMERLTQHDPSEALLRMVESARKCKTQGSPFFCVAQEHLEARVRRCQTCGWSDQGQVQEHSMLGLHIADGGTLVDCMKASFKPDMVWVGACNECHGEAHSSGIEVVSLPACLWIHLHRWRRNQTKITRYVEFPFRHVQFLVFIIKAIQVIGTPVARVKKYNLVLYIKHELYVWKWIKCIV